jgi:Dolichyl-phosphate-mannose-protein mannosyltransferase
MGGHLHVNHPMNRTQWNKVFTTSNIESWPTWYSRYGLDVAAILICCLSFIFSAVESTVNQDGHHWGVMFVPALALKHGLIPHRDTFIFYGALTSWIQGLGLYLFGENYKALGLTTGIFYSLSLWFSYRVFLTFLSKPFAFLGLLLVFLVHGYIIYPWPNYYFYTFELLAILYFIRGGGQKNYLISGGLIGVALLTRYTAIQAAIPQFIISIFFASIWGAGRFRTGLKKLLSFSIGLITPVLLFASYLIANNGLDNLILNSKLTFVAATGGNTSASQYLIRLLFNVFTFSTIFAHDSRSFCFTAIFFTTIGTLGYLFYRAISQGKGLSDRLCNVFFISLTALVSYTNSLHIYEIFRLANGAALGIGVILFWIEAGVHRYQKRVGLIMLVPIIAVCLFWGNSLILTRTSSVFSPWEVNTITGQGVAVRKEIGILAGKVVSPSFQSYYDEIYAKIASIDPSYPLVSYTLDTTAALIDQNRIRLQKVPAYFPNIQAGLPDEVAQINQAIQAKKVVIISDAELKLPGYQVILDIVALGPSHTGEFHIIIPDGAAHI